MSEPITTEMDVAPSYARSYSKSVGHDESQHGVGNPRINIDLGKSVNAITLCAAICGICMAITVMTVWHSQERETETQAQIRVLKNHIDDAYNKLTILEKTQ